MAVSCTQTQTEIRRLTDLSPKSLNNMLAELFDPKAIEKDGEGKYWISKELHETYREFFDTQKGPADLVQIQISEEE